MVNTKEILRHWKSDCFLLCLEKGYKYNSGQTENNLMHNIVKTMELIIDFRRKESKTHTPVFISGAEVEQMNTYRILGISIMENLGHIYITNLVKKAQKSLLPT